MVRPARDGNARKGIEERESDAREEAERGVGEPEVALDGLQEDREDLTVEEVEDVNDDEQPQRVAAVGGREQ